jgi:pimeloyl-ACP methyl ester carboxylesterase
VTATRYARSGDLSIAYQVIGDGPPDLVYVPGWISNIEVMWEEPTMAFLLRGLASFSRLILFDKRGTGLSDRVPLDRIPTLEERMDDVRAVMETVGSKSAFLLGHSEGGNMCSLFAATYPERTTGLILVSSYAKRVPTDDYPWAPTPEQREADIIETERHFGDPDHLPDWIAPSRIHDEAFREWVARYFRLGSSPQAAAHLLRMNTDMDVTAILPSIGVPTLCLYRRDDQDVHIEEGRWIAAQIPGARLIELPGADHLLNGADVEDVLAEVEEFVTGQRSGGAPERALATVSFTDIVGSTERARLMGDRPWSELLERFRTLVTAEVVRHRGRVVEATGDEVLATFDGPARAIKAARATIESVAGLGLEVRTGLHTGEVQVTAAGLVGLTVHIGARVVALAQPGEVLVSRTVRDLVAGSGFTFTERGSHSIKGLADEWQLYSVQ